MGTPLLLLALEALYMNMCVDSIYIYVYSYMNVFCMINDDELNNKCNLRTLSHSSYELYGKITKISKENAENQFNRNWAPDQSKRRYCEFLRLLIHAFSEFLFFVLLNSW